MKTILSGFLSVKENNKKIKELLSKKSFSRSVAVVFIVSIFVFLASAIIAGGFESYSTQEEPEILRKGSFVYAAQYLNPDEVIVEQNYAEGELAEDTNIILQDCALLAASSPSTLSSLAGQQRNEEIIYEVQSGDVISEIAAAFNVSVNTILWANNLSVWNYIKPGQKLVVLPVSGVKHTIKKGETLDQIVKNYKGDINKTIEFNALPANGILAVGREIIIPDGQKATYQSNTRSYATAYNFPRPFSDQSHKFPWGQCTWYVAQRRYIPWTGDAKTWIYKAPQFGFATGTEPKEGAIVQTRENSRYGHVAYVESVDGDYITVSEMHLGQGIRKVRTLRIDDWRIIGYIY